MKYYMYYTQISIYLVYYYSQQLHLRQYLTKCQLHLHRHQQTQIFTNLYYTQKKLQTITSKYWRKIFFTQLESYKRQLATYLEGREYVVAFQGLDGEKMGVISRKCMQNYLMKRKYFVKPVDLDRYFHRYLHGKDTLSYQDIVECLVPHSHYQLLSTTTHKITQSLLQKNHTSVYLCHRSENQIIHTMVALIIGTEIEDMKNQYVMMNDITNGSLKIGALLWRGLDRIHDNCVDFQRIRELCGGFGVEIREEEWRAFINWHFRSHKKILTRADFMVIFDTLIQNKRNGSDCNIEQFVQSQIMKKTAQFQRNRDAKVQQIVVERMESASRGLLRSASMQTSKKVAQSKISFVNPEADYHGKRLLYSKLGYKNPEKLIKMSEID